jgi:hypothetical protein
VENRIEACEAHHTGEGDLHFRFIGTAEGREFVVNVEFSAAGDSAKDRLRPIEYDFMTAKIIGLILKHLGETPNPGLH